MHARRDETCKMRHVHHQQRADAVADFAKRPEIDNARIGRAASDNQFRFVLTRKARDLFHIDPVIVLPHPIGHGLEPFARHVDRRAMGKMATGSQVEPHESVAGLQQGKKHFGVCRCPRVRLHVGELAAEKFRHALDCEPFRNVHELTPAVVTFTRQAFGILVGENRALRFKNSTRNNVLRSDQFDFVALAAKFELDRFGNFGIDLGQAGREQCLHVACWPGARGRRHHSLLAPGMVGADLWESA